MWARAKGRGLTLLALIAVVGGVALTTLTGGSAPAQAPTDSAPAESAPVDSAPAPTDSAPAPADRGVTAAPPPGSLVVALPALGQVNALQNGGTYILARNLTTPSAVAVLSDSSVLVAEQGASRVSGFGGRFGPVPVTIAEVPSPTGLVVGPGDSVYVTGSDQVGRIDLVARQYQALVGGFTAPIGPALKGNTLYVPDLATGRVATIDITTGIELGSAATGLAGPGGVATAPGLPVFVTETQGAGVVRIDDGAAPAPFASVVGALQLTLDPANPEPGSEWTLVVTTQSGLTRLNSDGSVVGLRTSLQGVAGAVVTPDPAAGAEGAAASDPGSTTVLKDEPSSSSSSLAVIVGLVALLVLAVVGVTVWFARRAGRREREDDGLMSSPPDPAGPPPVFGSCAEEEMEVDRLQELLRHVTTQLNDAQTRRRRSAELASDARDRGMRALEVRASIRSARQQAEPPPETEKLSWAQLSFSTNEGREAFESYRRREIDGAQLKSRFSELGETTAITQISDEGRRQLRGDPNVPWPEERVAVRDAIAARTELRAHVTEAEEAQAESDQLGARHQDLTAELEAARQRLDDCRHARPDPAA